MNRFFGARDVRLHGLRDLPLKLRHGLAAGLFEGCASFRVNLLEDRFGPALHFFALRVQHIFELRLKSR